MQDLKTLKLIERISTLLRSEERKRFSALGLQPIHAQVLQYISQCNQHSDTPVLVAEYLGLTKGTVSQSIQLLNRKGYIEKRSDPEDGRIVHLSLTEEGEALLQEMQPTNLFSEAEQLVSDEYYPSLSKGLSATLAALQKANNSRSFGICNSCSYFTEQDNHYQCQLTLLPLSQAEAEKICCEHLPISA